MKVVFGRHPKRTLVRLVCMVTLTVVLFRVVLIPIRVSGPSMYPTYHDGKVDLVNHLAYRWSKPKRGDVVAFRVPEEGNVVLLKRIVGLPGERVRLDHGIVVINGQRLDEPYAWVGKRGSSTGVELALKEDRYFVIGDNRPVSIYRQIPERYILGKVLF